MVTGLHPRCPLPPHPNPPPRRGEGRVGVMFLMFFLQRLSFFYSFLLFLSPARFCMNSFMSIPIFVRLSRFKIYFSTLWVGVFGRLSLYSKYLGTLKSANLSMH